MRDAECGMWSAECGLRGHAKEAGPRVISIGNAYRVVLLPVRAALLAALTATLLAALRTIALVALLALILVAAGALLRALSTLLLLVALLLFATLLILIAGVLVRVLVIHVCSSRESATPAQCKRVSSRRN